MEIKLWNLNMDDYFRWLIELELIIYMLRSSNMTIEKESDNQTHQPIAVIMLESALSLLPHENILNAWFRDKNR